MISEENWTSELMKLYSTSLHEKLKEKIKGHIFCIIEDDMLYVDIRQKDVRVSYRRGDMLSDIHKGLSVDYIVRDITKEYKKTLNTIFFNYIPLDASELNLKKECTFKYEN